MIRLSLRLVRVIVANFAEGCDNEAQPALSVSILEELQHVGILRRQWLHALVVKDSVHEEVLFEAVYGLGIDPENLTAGLVSKTNRSLPLLAVLYGAPHEKLEDWAGVDAVVYALGKGEEGAAVAELAHEFKLYEVDVHDSAVDKKALPLDYLATQRVEICVILGLLVWAEIVADFTLLNWHDVFVGEARD